MILHRTAAHNVQRCMFLQSYNEDIEDYQMVEEPNIQISSDDEHTAAHGSWRGGTAKQGAKRKQGADVGGSRCGRLLVGSAHVDKLQSLTVILLQSPVLHGKCVQQRN